MGKAIAFTLIGCLQGLRTSGSLRHKNRGASKEPSVRIMWEVLETTKNVVQKSWQVRVDQDALVRFSRNLREAGTEVPHWDHLYHYFDGGKDTVSYLLILDSLNFCFWPLPGNTKWEIEYESRKLSGYYALAASLTRSLRSGIPITSAEYLAKLSKDELRDILAGQGDLQLLDQRLQILRELGKALLQDYNGKAHRMVEAAGNSAIELVRLLAEKLVSFRDTALYQGHSVYFYKRAQILAADLSGAFDGKAWGRFTDMDKLTSFADYKLPQVLRHLGVLHYAPALARKVDQMEFIDPGSLEEIEIRASTIWAVELIRQELAHSGKNLKAFEIDWILWNLGQRDDFKIKPYHRTVTIFY